MNSPTGPIALIAIAVYVNISIFYFLFYLVSVQAHKPFKNVSVSDGPALTKFQDCNPNNIVNRNNVQYNKVAIQHNMKRIICNMLYLC